MAKILEREKARVLRRQGESIKVIARNLGLGPSTISYWCKDIVLTSKQIERLQERQRRAGSKAILKYAELKRNARIEKEKDLLRLGKGEVGKLSRRDVFLVGLALYWGEGYKSGNGEVGFTNSNAEMILFILHWFREIFGIRNQDFILRVSVNEQHRERIKLIERFWSDKTGIPLLQFSKISLIKVKTKKIYANAENHYGTLRVKVRRGTDLRRRILGGIEGLKYNA
ncbi:MAG: Uncharacterized protein G01um101417_340 [Parcubacteria group bacterium Gr01-1014_17]|nr:MAG: Uncharacterized protein G01um101417_340 [Parcubacteria group bacterium Gr01-1014_17]